MVSVLGLVAGIAAAGAKKSCCRRSTFRRQELFADVHSQQLVQEARSYDPNFTRREQAHRDKAIALYEQAIAAQPQAPLSAHLARRIAELYAYYEDKAKGFRAEPAKAVPWWRRAIELSNPRQLLWVQAHMGLGSSTFLTGDARGGAAAFQAVLAADPDRMELPNWQSWPPGDTPREQKLLAEARACVREKTLKARLKAVENVHYTLIRRDGAAMAEALLAVAKTHKGTPAGDRAMELVLAAIGSPKTSIYRYRGLPDAFKDELAAAARRPGSSTAPTREPATTRAATPRTGTTAAPDTAAVARAPAPRTPAPVEAPEPSGLGPLRALALVGGCIAGAVAIGAWIARRRGP